MSITGMFNIKVNVERPAYTQDDYGGRIETWSTQYTNMPGRLQAKRSGERIYGDARTMMSDFVLYCGTNFTIQADDRIVYNSENYLVTGIDPNSNRMNLFQKLNLLKVA